MKGLKVDKMLKIICTKKCIYKGRVYKPGRETTINPDGVFPEKCFVYKNTPPVRLSLPKCHGSVTLLGDGPTLQYAIDNPGLIKTPVAAINKAGVRYPGKMDYWLSLHAEYFALWRNRRKKAGFDIEGIKFIGHRVPAKPEVIRSTNHLKAGGGSALYAVQTLELMGFDRIHVIGVDLIGEKYEIFRPSFKVDDYKIKITAHSGFLKRLFS